MAIKVYIKENSWIARISAFKLGVNNCATAIGSTIHLHNTSRNELIKNTAWLRHEVCHVKQWNDKGYLLFLFDYVWLSIRYGYYQNPYEKEAREAESNVNMLNDVEIVGEVMS